MLPIDDSTPLRAAASLRSALDEAARTPGIDRNVLDKALEGYRKVVMAAFPTAYPCPPGGRDLWDVVEPEHRPGLFYVLGQAICREQAMMERAIRPVQ